MKVHPRDRKPRQQKASLQCNRCNGTNHDTSTCRYVNTKCNFCSIVGHIERACRKKKKQQEAATKRSKPRKLHKVDEEEGSSSSDDMFMLTAINSITSKCNDAMYATPRVNGKHLKMQIDTGSAKSVMTLNDFEKNIPRCEVEKD